MNEALAFVAGIMVGLTLFASVGTLQFWLWYARRR
jgi:hypothetical protein